MIHEGAFAARREGTFMDQKPFQRPILVSLDEAASLLSVSLRTVQRMAKDGRLAVVRLTPDAPRVRYADLLRLYAGEVRGS